MPRISSYPLDKDPKPSDILLGTDRGGGTNATKNFSLEDINNQVLETYFKNISWEFYTEETPLEKASMYFTGGGTNSWANVTEITVNCLMGNNSDSLPYLEYLLSDQLHDKHVVVDNTITLYDKNDLGSFGIFTFTGITNVPYPADPTIKLNKLSLTYIDGSGGLEEGHFYGIALDPIESQDDTFIFHQAVSSATWTINHNLKKYPSVTVVDSANTVVEGVVTYNSINQLTLSFSATFSGYAYLN